MTQDSPQLDIPLSKGKNSLLILGALAFVACGVWLWNIADTDKRHDPTYTKVVSVVCIGFFGWCALIGVTKLLDRKPGLSLGERGITDNSSGFSCGLIEWEDIEGVDVAQVKATRILLIYVADPKAYLSKMNPIKRLMMKLTQRMHGTPFSISSNSLSCEFSTLVTSIESRISKTKSQPIGSLNGS
jgi:hypothetical protein